MRILSRKSLIIFGIIASLSYSAGFFYRSLFPSERVPVGVGDYKLAKRGKISSGDLSSCSVLCFYDKEKKLGAMAHFSQTFPENTNEETRVLEKIAEEMDSGRIDSVLVRCSRYENCLSNLAERISKVRVCFSYSNNAVDVELNLRKGEVIFNDASKSCAERYVF